MHLLLAAPVDSNPTQQIVVGVIVFLLGAATLAWATAMWRFARDLTKLMKESFPDALEELRKHSTEIEKMGKRLDSLGTKVEKLSAVVYENTRRQ